MSVTLFFSMLSFLWVAAITPGPNNLLLTTSGATFGFRRSLGLVAGIMLGMQSVLWLTAFGVGGMVMLYPALHTALKVIGSLYLLWLAWKITFSAYESLETTHKKITPVRWYQGGILQFLNPKAWLMALGAVASFTLSGDDYLLSVEQISMGMLLVNALSGVIWLGFGTGIGRLLSSRRAWVGFNAVMGTLTASCVLLIWH